MRKIIISIILIYFLGLSVVLGTIIPSDRRIDWNPGVTGGIPTYPSGTNVVGLDNTGATDISATLQYILNHQSASNAVVLPSGVFRIDSKITIPNYTVLRGSGTNTIISMNIGGAAWAAIDFSQLFGGDQSLDIYTNTSNISVGSTNVYTTTSNTALSPGDNIVLDQLNDHTNVWEYGTEDYTTPLLCDYCSRNSGSRIQGQTVEVISIINGTNITFKPGLYWNMAATLSPQVYYRADFGSGNAGKWAGIENLTISNSPSSEVIQIIDMEYVQYCWVTNIHDIGGGDRAHILLYMSKNCSIQHNFFDHAAGLTSSSGGGLNFGRNSCDDLVENNIFWMIRDPLNFTGSTMGNVAGYNYLDVQPGTPQTFQVTTIAMHGGHEQFNLIEGNILNKYHADFIHGSGSHNTIFRNWITGRQQAINGTNITQAQFAISIDITNRYYNAVGNILGYSGITNDVPTCIYEIFGPNDTFVYENTWYAIRLGYNSCFAPPQCPTALSDSVVASSFLLHGNWDWLNCIIKWDGTISDHNLPNSYYLNSKPVWMGDRSWPPIDPNNPVVSISSIPAGYRFLNGIDPPTSQNSTAVTTLNTTTLNIRSFNIINP